MVGFYDEWYRLRSIGLSGKPILQALDTATLTIDFSRQAVVADRNGVAGGRRREDGEGGRKREQDDGLAGKRKPEGQRSQDLDPVSSLVRLVSYRMQGTNRRQADSPFTQPGLAAVRIFP